MEQELPDERFELINCGGCSYASYRLVDLVEECMQYSPDLVIIMSGHNEFLEARHYADLIGSDSAGQQFWYSLRTVRLVGDLSTRYQSRSAVLGDNPFISAEYIARDGQEYRWTLDHYTKNLKRMSQACRQHGVPLILCTCPSNLRDQKPFHSEARGELSPQEYDQRILEFDRLFGQREFEGALAVAQQVLAKDPRNPLFHYNAGRCQYALENWSDARQSLIRAKDLDMFPRRALSSINDRVREVASESGALLLDAEALYFDKAEHGIPGDDLFSDDCHPTPEGHRLFAAALLPLALQALQGGTEQGSAEREGRDVAP